jgi:hypothetical protein
VLLLVSERQKGLLPRSFAVRAPSKLPRPLPGPVQNGEKCVLLRRSRSGASRAGRAPFHWARARRIVDPTSRPSDLAAAKRRFRSPASDDFNQPSERRRRRSGGSNTPRSPHRGNGEGGGDLCGGPLSSARWRRSQEAAAAIAANQRVAAIEPPLRGGAGMERASSSRLDGTRAHAGGSPRVIRRRRAFAPRAAHNNGPHFSFAALPGARGHQ